MHMEWSHDGTSLGKLVYSKGPEQWQHLWFGEDMRLVLLLMQWFEINKFSL